jgi:hypothetical protein
MKRAEKVWDFLFGVALIGGAPLAALFAVLIGFYILRPSSDVRLIGLLTLIFSTTAFGIACIWRRKHRHLRSSLLFVEILVAVLSIALFILACMAITHLAHEAN